MTSGTKYSYALFTHDAAPEYSIGVAASATVTVTSDPPPPVTNVTATSTTTTITLTWSNPASAPLTGVLIRRAVGSSVPTSPTGGSFVADVAKPGTSFTDDGLTPGTKYSYALFAHDVGPAYADGVTTDATTTVVAVDSIAGTVTDAGGTHRGLHEVRVDVISIDTGDGFSTATGFDGSWSVFGLPEGKYSVCFFGDEADGGSSDQSGYVDQCYLNQPTADKATPVTVTDGVTRTGVDAALVGAGRE